MVSGGLNGPAPRPSFCLLPLKKVKLPRHFCENCALVLTLASVSVVLSGMPWSVRIVTLVRASDPHPHHLFFRIGPPTSPP